MPLAALPCWIYSCEALPIDKPWALFDNAMWPLRTIIWMNQAVWIDHTGIVRRPSSIYANLVLCFCRRGRTKGNGVGQCLENTPLIIQFLTTFIVSSTVPLIFFHTIFDSLALVSCHLAAHKCSNQSQSHLSAPSDILLFQPTWNV